MAKMVALGCEPVVGSLTSSRKKEYRVTNRLQEGKRPLYAVAFNFIDSRYFNVFATVGGNRVRKPCNGLLKIVTLSYFSIGFSFFLFSLCIYLFYFYLKMADFWLFFSPLFLFTLNKDSFSPLCSLVYVYDFAMCQFFIYCLYVRMHFRFLISLFAKTH